ncbi:MAG: NERD domain-containing protein [Rhodocyclales bacterium]|nr:NERD domain-containing protein [Rhodocyclales bacterium]
MDFMYDRVLGPMLIASSFVLVAMLEWLREFFPSLPGPWFWTVVAVSAVGYSAWRIRRALPEARKLRQAEEGEKAIGQLLEGLRASGYSVFHDLIGDGFNVDHVIVGPAGVFTIETKAWSKPAKGPAEITFDGESLLVAGREPERNPVVQAKAQANWLRQILAESTGKSYSVWPTVLFPGWYIKNTREGFKDLWVLEPKAFTKFLANEKVELAPEDISLAAFHLSQFIRGQERLSATR